MVIYVKTVMAEEKPSRHLLQTLQTGQCHGSHPFQSLEGTDTEFILPPYQYLLNSILTRVFC